MTPSTSQHNILGAAWMTAAMLGYVVNDAFIKLVAEDVPLFQAVFLRGLVVTAILVFVLDKTMGIRVTEDEELEGLDLNQHGERAYNS